MSSRPPVSVHLLPSLIPTGALAGGVAVVIDVLRATSAMTHALASGCASIIPCGEVEEARRVAEALPKGTALLAGERQGLPIPGFDLGNSPSSFSPEVCSGQTVVMTTTNGTRAILASLAAERVLVASFPNRKATLDLLGPEARPIHIVCAGTDGQISLEDSLLAGALAHELDARAFGDARDKPNLHGRDGDLPSDTTLANDQAEIVATLWRETWSLVEQGYTLAEALGDGRGGRRVQAIGLAADIADAAELDRFDVVGELRRNPLRIEAVSPAGGHRTSDS